MKKINDLSLREKELLAKAKMKTIFGAPTRVGGSAQW